MDKRKETDYLTGIRRLKCCPWHIPPHGRDNDYEFIRQHHRDFRASYNGTMRDINQSKRENSKKMEELSKKFEGFDCGL
jgi:hypothetical protein